MGLADELWRRLHDHPMAELYGPQVSGVVLWRPRGQADIRATLTALPAGLASITNVDGTDWLRNVAANPCADVDRVWAAIQGALS